MGSSFAELFISLGEYYLCEGKISPKRRSYIISKCSKLAQKEYKTRHDWVSKVIHWELSKNLTFDQTNKWYMHNPESVPENETHKLLSDFEIQTDHLISVRRPDLIIINSNKKKKKKEENFQDY